MNRRNVLAAICAIPILGTIGHTKEVIGKTFIDENINIVKPTKFYKCKFVDCKIIDNGFPIEINTCTIDRIRVKNAEISRNFKG